MGKEKETSPLEVGDGRMILSLVLSAEQWEALQTLATSQATPKHPPAAIVTYLVQAMADGIRRPGSWEAQCVAQLFGPFERVGSSRRG